MTQSSIITSLIISIVIFFSSTSIMLAASNLPKKLGRFWVTALSAISVFSAFYWACRSLGVPSSYLVDVAIRLSHALLSAAAMWEGSLLLRVWAKSGRIKGLDIVDTLSQGDDIMLARMAVEQINQPAWARSSEGRIIASNPSGKEILEVIGESGDKEGVEKSMPVIELKSGSKVIIGQPASYHHQGAH